MSYNDDAVLAKLSALNETQESIVSWPCPLLCLLLSILLSILTRSQVTVAQWVMFHRSVRKRLSPLRRYHCTDPAVGDTQIELASCGCNA